MLESERARSIRQLNATLAKCRRDASVARGHLVRAQYARHAAIEAVLREIRDECGPEGRAAQNQRAARPDDPRFDRTNSRLDDHEKVLVRLVDLPERHENVLRELVDAVDVMSGRFDNILNGAHKQEHDELRARLEWLEHEAGSGGPTRWFEGWLAGARL